MRALLQRVTQASVSVRGKDIAQIGKGLLIFLGVAAEDNSKDTEYLANKIINLRIFSDQKDRFTASAIDIGAEILVVSQFTLNAETRKGRRPSFLGAAHPDKAEELYKQFLSYLSKTELLIQTGSFGDHMTVEITNDRPVTIMLDSIDRNVPRRSLSQT
mgnify:CR=1 FL=1